MILAREMIINLHFRKKLPLYTGAHIKQVERKPRGPFLLSLGKNPSETRPYPKKQELKYGGAHIHDAIM